MKKALLVVFSAIIMTGCITQEDARKLSNKELITCALADDEFYARDESKHCAAELKERVSNGKASPEELKQIDKPKKGLFF